MTCNPAIASCLETAILLESTTALTPGLFSPMETAPLGGTPETDRYETARPVFPRSTGSSAGLLSLFRETAPACDTENHLPPLDTDLRLSDYRNEFPSSFTPYVDL